MIPLELAIENFLSYRERVVLDLEGIHLACISGLNGAGKSALLDAMTWSLFGKSRSRSDDDLVNRMAARNDEAAEVRFLFKLEGNVYRVIRQKQKGKTTLLELQMNKADGAWQTLTEGGVRATEAAIEALLSMNFESFVNASFFLQGQADEFTTKTAGKRKEILADLLGVNEWDQYKERAAERRRQEESALIVLDARLGEIDAELGEVEERESALAQAEEALAAISLRLKAGEEILGQMRRVEAAAEQQRRQVHNLRQSLTVTEGRLSNLRQTEQRLQGERESHQVLLDAAEAIAENYSAWQEAQKEFEVWQEKAERFSRIEQKRRPHELALERARTELRERQQTLERQQELVSTMGAEQEELQQQLAAAQEQLAALDTRLESLAQQEETLHTARAVLQKVEGERERARQDLEQLQRQAKRIERMEDEGKAVRSNLADAQAELDRLAEEAVTLARSREQHAEALGARDGLKAEQSRLRQEMNKLHDRLQRLREETGNECPLCGQPLSETHRREVLAQVKAEGDELGVRFRRNKETIEALEAEVTMLEKGIRDGARLERDHQTQQMRKARAEARLEEVEQALAEWKAEGRPEQIAALEARLADEEEIKQRAVRVDELAAAVAEKKTLEAKQRAEQKKLSATEARLAEIVRAQKRWKEDGEPQLEAVRRRLAEEDYAAEARSALAQLETERASVAYDEEAHQEARRQRDELSTAPARYRELREAEAATRPLEDNLEQLAEQIVEQEKERSRLQKQHEEASTELAMLQGSEEERKRVEEEVQDLREEKVNAERRVGAAQQRLDVLDDLRRQREEEAMRRADATERIRQLKLLENACGRDGVQALLIERALPEIEEDANQLLERLTGGKMRVYFETQRALKSRDGLAETLDIHISDAVGERPYENFSGGEQFRVNFAIRLALSRILARRAGARLQTLVIDEGFGSQDPDGRQRLVEAINIVKEDFERILVITHINELKDAFPTRIHVEKSPQGSELTVI